MSDRACLAEGQGQTGVGLAVHAGCCVTAGSGEGAMVPGSGHFDSLGAADRRRLSDWQAGAAPLGVDAVLDLSMRAWNVPDSDLILGVFESGRDTASWLVARHAGGWMVARCADGFVSEEPAPLPDVLGWIDQSLRA